MTWFQSGSNQTAADAVHVEEVTLVEMDLPSGYLRLHTRIGDLVANGNTFLGVGKFGSISDIDEDAALRPAGVTFTLSGVDSALVTSARTEAYHGRAVVVYEGYLNVTTLALIAAPEVKFRGSMDKMVIDLGTENSSITVHAEGELARWNRSSGLLFTAESQRLLYPNDKGLDNIIKIQNRTVNWEKRYNWGFSMSGRFPRPNTGPG